MSNNGNAKNIKNSGNGSFESTIEEETLDLGDYFRILARNKWYILAIALVIIGLGTYKTMTSQPIYQSKAKIMIESQTEMSDIFQISGQFTNETLANEMEILQSKELKARLIMSLWDSELKDNLYVLGTRQTDTTRGILSSVKSGAKRIIKTIMPSPKRDSALEEDDDSYILLNEWVSSRIEELPPRLSLEKLDTLVMRLESGSFDMSPKRESTIINLSYKSPGKKEAQLVLEKFVNIYQRTDEQRSAKEITKLNIFLNQKVVDREKDLKQARNKLEAYQEKELVFGVEEKNKAILEQTTQIESKYYNARAEVEIKEQELKLLRSQLSQRENQLAERVSNVVDSELRALRGELVRLQAKLVQTVNKYSPDHPEVQTINQDITKIKNKLNNKTSQLVQQGISVSDPIAFSQELVTKILKAEAELEAQKAKVKELKKIVDQYNKELKTLPQKQLRYAELRRELNVLEKNYLFLRQKQQETKIQRAFEAGKIRIIDHASRAQQVEPNVKMDLLLTILVGIGLGVGFALLKDTMTTTIKSVDELQEMGVPVLSTIPNIKPVAREIQEEHVNSKINNEIVTFFKPLHPVSESYRNLRTNINLSTADETITSILTTSAGASEGKTTITCNLGITFANMGRKTLIMDCDLRKSRVHKEFGLDQNEGLVDYLAGDIDLAKIIKPTEQENLSVISAGGHPPNPAELLNSDKMQKLIKTLDREWDNVLYDSPPLIPVTDPIILANYVDFVVISSMIEQTHYDALNRAMEKLNQVNTKVNGLILNGLQKKHSKYSKYNYYYKRYYQYYRDDDSSKKNIFTKIFT